MRSISYFFSISSEEAAIENYFIETCKLFPDARISKRVPLPPAAFRTGPHN